MTAPQPTLAGFNWFIRNVMDVDTNVLPDDSPVIPFALALAMAVVNRQLWHIPIPSADAAGVQLNTGGFSIYSQAVYSLAGSNLINYAPDQNGENFFKDLRKKGKFPAFSPGGFAGLL